MYTIFSCGFAHRIFNLKLVSTVNPKTRMFAPFMYFLVCVRFGVSTPTTNRVYLRPLLGNLHPVLSDIPIVSQPCPIPLGKQQTACGIPYLEIYCLH